MDRSILNGISSLRKLLPLIFLISTIAMGQQFNNPVAIAVTVGTTSPANSKAVLDVRSTTRGVLLPRMTTTQQNAISSPTEGLLIYDTVLHQFSDYNGSAWAGIGGSVAAATTSSLGIVKASTPVTHQFLTGITATTGAITQAQPACSDLSNGSNSCSIDATNAANISVGTLSAARMPAPTATTLGGTESLAAVTHNFLTSITTSGVPTQAQPAFTDISGSVAAAQLPNPSASTLGGIESLALTTSKWISAISTSGVPSATQPNFSDLLGNVNLATQQNGVLPIANGGTNNGSLGITAGSMYYADGSKLVSIGAGTTGQVPTSAGSTVAWGTPSGGTGINYIVNPGGEIDASSWNVYAVAGQVAPTDCSTTVGSTHVTLTQTTSTPLTGLGSLLYTKDAVNRQGEGTSTDFTIDNAQKAKVMAVEFDYQVASGTFVAGSPGVDSDLEVWIYDKTNALLIQPSTFKIFSNSSTIPSHYIANFQTSSNSISYRLCIHSATVSAVAYTVKLDTVSVSPSKYVYGTPVTDWAPYTPTFTGLGTVVSPTGYSRRVGDTLQVKGKVTAGISTGTPALVSIGYNGANANVTIDTSKVPANNLIGYAMVSSNSTTLFTWTILAPASNGSTVVVALQSSTTQGSTNSTIASTSVPTGTILEYYFEVPIVGWSSSVQMSDSSPQSDVGGQASGSNQTFANGGTDLQITTALATVSNDLNGSWDGAGTYTAKIPGNYLAFIKIDFNAVPTGLIAVKYKLNSGSTNSLGAATSPTQFTSIPGWTFLHLNAGDTLKFYVNNGTATNPITTDFALAMVFRLGGNQTIGLVDSIGFKYTNSAGTSIPNTGDNNVPFATLVYDRQGLYNTSTGIATLQTSGVYEADCAVTFVSNTYAVNNQLVASIYQNGAAASYGPVTNIQAIFTNSIGESVHTDIVGKAGDTVECRALNNRTAGATALTATASFNHFELRRVGN